MRFAIETIDNVITQIRSTDFPEELIIRGNHHDSWVNRANGPVSAFDALLEEIRGFAELLEQGWQPRRTIIYCSWDGEESVVTPYHSQKVTPIHGCNGLRWCVLRIYWLAGDRTGPL